MKTFLVTTILLTSIGSFAQDRMGDRGNGGNVECAEFVDVTVEAMNDVTRLSEQERNEINPNLPIQALVEAASNLRCIPVSTDEDRQELDRDARSRMVDGVPTTRLDIVTWVRKSAAEKVRLALHELAVNLQLDGEDDYRNSRYLFEMRNLQKSKARNRCSIYINQGPDIDSKGMKKVQKKLEEREFIRNFNSDSAIYTLNVEIYPDFLPSGGVNIVNNMTGDIIYQNIEYGRYVHKYFNHYKRQQRRARRAMFNVLDNMPACSELQQD